MRCCCAGGSTMRERDIRAWLRGACKARVIEGWYVTGEPFERIYHINPGFPGRLVSLDAQAVEDQCVAWWSDVVPVYRDSEPDFEAAA
jgi:hypothetical protein